LQGSQRREFVHLLEGDPLYGTPRESGRNLEGWRCRATVSRRARKISDDGRVQEETARIFTDDGQNQRYRGYQQQGFVGSRGELSNFLYNY